jgi:hypothetical protein
MQTPGILLEEKKPSTTKPVAFRRTGADYMMGILVAAFIAAVAKGIVSAGEGPDPIRPVSLTTATQVDPQRFILNGLLVPSLDTDEVALRWADPRPAIQCGPGASVRVDGEPLIPGALVPVAPFELEWHADGCRPFGTAGPRFDGDVKLTVFREDWGFSAIITPRDLRIMTPGQPSTAAHPGVAAMPQSAPEGEGLLSE